MAEVVNHWVETLKTRLVAKTPTEWASMTFIAAGAQEPQVLIETAVAELVGQGRLEMLSRGSERLYRRPSGQRSGASRSSWDEYFMRIAEVVASRATCDRKHVGAVIVRDKSILATGYNGSIRGLPHCDDEGHLIEDNHCVRTVHAEASAIVQAARNGVRIDGASIYVTACPCWGCFRLVANAGIARVVFGEPYLLDEKVTRYAAELGVELVPLESGG